MPRPDNLYPTEFVIQTVLSRSADAFGVERTDAPVGLMAIVAVDHTLRCVEVHVLEAPRG